MTRTLADDESMQAIIFARCFTLMSALDGVPENADELEDFYINPPQNKKHELFSIPKHKAQGQKAWLAVLHIANTKDQTKRVLDVMSTVIAPWFSNPELLADFLTSSYDAGGSMSLLALSGVFYLIKERNLDYPSFYPKLYSLLDRDLLHSKHRSRFLRLMDTFLNSTHLPAALVASFIKRLGRLALNAPPSAIVSIVPWMYNILKHHPQCTFMIHREVRDPEVQKHIDEEGAKDPFNPEETDPLETGAIDSCLWEVVQLQSHYHPNVATIAKIISEQFTKQAYNIEDFLDHSYATVRLAFRQWLSSLLTMCAASGCRDGQGGEESTGGRVHNPQEGFHASGRPFDTEQPDYSTLGFWKLIGTSGSVTRSGR